MTIPGRRGPGAGLPHHVGIIPDGNRRWARSHGRDIHSGHQRGADKVPEVLGWCDRAGIEIVTLYLLSTRNLGRSDTEALVAFVEQVVTRLAADTRYRLRPIGCLELLPDATRDLLTEATEATEATETAKATEATEAAETVDAARRVTGRAGMRVNLAIAYSGRQDILTAVRAALAEPGTPLTEALVDRHLSTAGQPDPDLIIRTSGEHRLSGFLTWQAEQAELCFCARAWPAFRRGDLHRALRWYARRQRRYGR